VLGLREEAVAQRLSRARQRMRERLDREGLAALALPALLSGLSPSTAAHGGSASALAHVVARASAHAYAPWSVAAGIAAIGAAILGVATHTTAPAHVAAASILPAQAAPLAVTLSPRTSWSFDGVGDIDGLRLMNGAWHHVGSGSFDGSGYMAIDTQDFAISLDTSTLPLPLRLSCRTRAGEGSTFLCAQWDCDRRHAASFAGVGTLEPPAAAWSSIEVYIDQRTLDHWINGHRYGLLELSRAPGAALKIVMRDQHAIDDLRIEPVERSAIPAMAPFLAAFDAVPPDDRHGRVLLPGGARLPGVTAPEVWLIFGDAIAGPAPINQP
jgi:hypothetical protein